MIAKEVPVIANSLWTATAPPPPDCPALAGDEEADLVILGGGFSGLSAALHAAEHGLRAVVLEAETPGWGASGRNGGQVNPGLKADPDETLAKFGPDKGAKLVELTTGTGDYLFDLVRRHGIDCDAVQAGWIQTALTEPGLDPLRARDAQWLRAGGRTRMIDRDEIHELLGVEGYSGGLLYESGGTVHPLKLALGLCRAAQSLGVVVHGNTRVTSVETHEDRVVMRAPGGSVTAAKALICVNGYGDAAAGKLPRTVVPFRSVQVATEPLPQGLRDRLMPRGHHASDTQRLTTYFRMSPDGRFMTGGRGRYGEAGCKADLQRLREMSIKIRPELEEFDWEFAWGGNVALTVDHYPKLHLNGPRVLSSMGFNGRGVALATTMGGVLADWAAGRDADDLPMPLTRMRPIPFHMFRNVGVGLTVAKFQVMDALGI